MKQMIQTCNRMKFVFLLLLAGSCGGGGNSGSVAQTPANPDSALIGIWENASCDRLSNDRRSDFAVYNPDGSFQFTIRVYSSSNCTDLLYTASRFSSFVEGSDIMLADGQMARELDYGPETSIQITPQSEAGAATLNSFLACGISDWEQGVIRSVLGCQTGVGNIEFVAQPANFEIYQLVDNHFLFFGTELSFTAANRPTQLRTAPTLVRRLTAADSYPAAVIGFWQVEGRQVFLEMRANAIIYAYIPSQTDASCFDRDIFAMQRLEDTTYFDFLDTTYTLQPTASGLDLTITQDQQAPALLPLVRNDAIAATDLVLCNS